MKLELPAMADHIAMVKTAMLAPTSALKTQFFADKTLATNLKPLVDAKVVNAGAAAKLAKGSVVTLTPVQYNDLMINTNGATDRPRLRSGLPGPRQWPDHNDRDRGGNRPQGRNESHVRH
jgi:hypothetical protein